LGALIVLVGLRKLPAGTRERMQPDTQHHMAVKAERHASGDAGVLHALAR